ncbi:MAG: SH3 domain-containing protein [Eubacteriales bacterium]|nr:SH3 domain-containing protein [Eubacteriales bacterium]
MRKLFRKFKRISAAAFSVVLGLNTAGTALFSSVGLADPFVLTSYAEQSAIVNTDKLNVRSGPGTGYSKVTSLIAGTTVSVTGETTGTDGYKWYAISFSGGSGYARYDLISLNTVYAASDATFENWMASQGFPESYKNGLRGLHQKYPNWIFKAQNTGLDWNTVIAEESKIGRNLVANSSISSWKSIATGAFDWANNYWPGFDGATWVQASTELISYYMDPRNFLSDPYVFQFELQTYDPSVQTKEGLQKLISGTFLDSEVIVPVEGSQVPGGTIIEGSSYGVFGTGVSSGTSSGSTSSGSNAAGPGGYVSVGSSTSSSTIGPGMTMGSVTPGSTASSGTASAGSNAAGTVGAVGAGPGPSADTGSAKSSSLLSAVESALGVIDAYANWQKDEKDASKWVYYEKSTGTFLNDGWHWLDGNNDGIAECYYFYSDGSLAVSTTVDGYAVNEDGKWINESGAIETKSAAVNSATASSSGTSAGSIISAGTGTSAGSIISTGTGSGTATAGTAAGQMKKVSYADIIMKAAEVSGVSPYVLASAILQEQGKGTSDLISGNSSSYPGIYNYYNTGAYAHDGMSAVTAGLKYASESGTGDRPWNTIEKAIIGGARLYGTNYVNAGQDTFYLKKYNVQGSNKYNHQFMTHVLAAASEGAKVSAAYSDSMKAQALEFKIPIYSNMPESTSLPTGDGNPNNKLSALSVEGYTITPTFNMDTESYSLIVNGSSNVININASTIDSGATVSGAGQVALNIGQNDLTITVRAQNGSERNYRLSVTRRQDDTIAMTDTAGMGTAVPGSSASNVNIVSDNAAGAVTPGSTSGTVSPGSTAGQSAASGAVISGPGSSATSATSAVVNTDQGVVSIGQGPS